MSKRLNFYISIICMLAAGCAHEAGKPAASPEQVQVQKPAVMDPFRFHKLIEVAPGEDFDILSWGRGSSSTGSFLILHSDSADQKYTTTTGDLEGTIVDVYNSDMDLDGNPEILIQAKATDTSNYAIVYAYEFTNNKAEKLDFPKLTSSQRKGYRGEDNFYIQDGKFMRQFPVYDGNGKDAKPTGQKRLLQYGLRNNEFTVLQLSTDSTVTKNATTITPKPVTVAPVKSTSNQNNTTTSKRKKKHHTEEPPPAHHKKKKHHRNQD